MLKKLAAAVVCIFLFAGTVSAIEFSADTISTFKGEQRLEGKMYFKPDKFRMDMKTYEDMFIITRIDKKVVWNVMPEQRMYMEMPLDLTHKPKVEEKFEGEIERKEVGRETIDGHPTIKYLITFITENKREQAYQWLATDINFPVKMSAVDGSWTQEYRNIKITGQPDSLFEVPAGFQKMQMPQIPGGLNFQHMK